MSQQIINVGSSPNDGAGDPIRTAFTKTNTNFTQLFALPNPTPPSTLLGKAGDVPGMYAYSASYFYYCFGTYDGSTTIWAQIPQINISANSIVNGTSNVKINSANANITVGVAGTSNVAVFTNTGITTADLSVTGTSNFTANINAGNLLANYISSAGNVRGINFNTSGRVTAVGNVYGNNIIATGIITSTGTFRLPNYTTAQIANLSAVEGDMVYNSDLKKVQAYQANSLGNVTWVSFTTTT